MDKLKSRKLIVVIITMLIIVVNELFNRPVSEDGITKIIAVAGTYLIGQGIADHGAQGKKPEVVIAVDEDEGPGWEETATVDDDEDERKELLG